MTRHTTNNHVPHDESDKSRRRRLEESPKGAQLPGRDNKQREASPQCKQPECHPLGGRRIIRHPYRSKRTKMGHNLHRKGLPHKRIKKTEDQCNNFNNKRSGWGPRGVTTSVVEKCIPPEPRFRSKQSNIVSRKHEINAARKEWACVKLKPNKTH